MKKTLSGNVQHSSSNVIDEALSPAPPSTCDSPVLLIRSAGNSNWFAAGLPED
jgi:hypothetical protein